jgi:hypothetical protein
VGSEHDACTTRFLTSQQRSNCAPSCIDRVGVSGKYLNINEAPWLVNGGHGASLKAHKHSWPTCPYFRQSACGTGPPAKDNTGAGESDAGIDHHGNWLRFPYESTVLRSIPLSPPAPDMDMDECSRRHAMQRGNDIEAPWLVSGRHGASLRQHKSPDGTRCSVGIILIRAE